MRAFFMPANEFKKVERSHVFAVMATQTADVV
jgi:hypothetical protein